MRKQRIERIAGGPRLFPAGRPFHVARLNLAAGHTFPVHTHDGFSEIVYVTRGQLRHTINGTLHHQAPGALTFIRAQDTHLLATAKGVEFVNTAFTDEALGRLADCLGHGPWQELRFGPDVPTAQVPPATQVVFNAILCDLLAQTDSASGGWRFLQVVSTAFADHLLPRPAVTAPQNLFADSANPQQPLPAWLASALAVIEPQAAAGKTPDCGTLVKLCGRTNEHVARTFRRYFGVTPSAYLNQLRLERAAQLLATGSRSVTEVSLAAGFHNLGYFHRCFRERYGITPRRWRHRG